MQSYTTYIEVDLDAIAHNVQAARQFVQPAQVMAVVKANAYGHGAVEVAKTALENGATWLAVARVIERTLGWPNAAVYAHAGARTLKTGSACFSLLALIF